MRSAEAGPIGWDDPVAHQTHEDQLVSDAELVRALLRDRHPRWADGPITEISSTGTDHALYRLGADAVARVPLCRSATQSIDTEFRWLPWLAERLPIGGRHCAAPRGHTSPVSLNALYQLAAGSSSWHETRLLRGKPCEGRSPQAARTRIHAL